MFREYFCQWEAFPHTIPGASTRRFNGHVEADGAHAVKKIRAKARGAGIYAPLYAEFWRGNAPRP